MTLRNEGSYLSLFFNNQIYTIALMAMSIQKIIFFIALRVLHYKYKV